MLGLYSSRRTFVHVAFFLQFGWLVRGTNLAFVAPITQRLALSAVGEILSSMEQDRLAGIAFTSEITA